MLGRSRKSINKKNNSVKCYDDNLSEELAETLEEIAQSGKSSLEESDFLKIKNICRRSDKYVKEAYNIILDYLQKNHAEIRRTAFQICNQLFRRSHCFRELVVCNLEKVVKLTTSEDLPPPQKVARELRQFALRCIHEWNTAFGQAYKKLAIGYRYLQQVEKIDFDGLLEDSTGQRRQRPGTADNTINRVRRNKTLADVKEKKAEIKTTVTSLSNSINLLLPHPDEFFVPIAEDEDGGRCGQEVAGPGGDSDVEDADAAADAGLREVGMVNCHHSLQLDLTPGSEVCIQETPENAVIIENVREYAKVIQNKYLPTVKGWLAVLNKYSGSKEELDDVAELQGEIDDVLFKYGRMAFVSADEVSSDSDLEEVPELQFESKPSKPSTKEDLEWDVLYCGNRTKTPKDVVFKKESTDESQPSTSTGVGSERKQRLMAVAPKLPFDVDLYHWEDDKLPVPTLVPSSTDGHRFWVGSEGSIDELPVPEGSAALRTRVIEFTGTFTPVAHSCRVRMPSGKLCPRRDRFKCPFHGEIVQRDDFGNCINAKDAIRMQELREKQQQKNPDWQNPKLLSDIKKATGIDLKMPEKGKRRKRTNSSGLTDLKEIENSAKKRLEKKIFKKSVVKKVASAMDKMDQKKYKDK